MKKIDFHCHATKRKINDVIPESADINYLAKEMQKYEIEKTVLLATYFPHKSSGISNYRLYHWIKDRPEFVMFGSLDFEHYFYQGYNELEEMAEERLIKGIKIYTCYQNIDLSSKNFGRIISLAKKQNLPVMFHGGYSYTSFRRYGRFSVANLIHPKDLEFLAKEHPTLKIIISHLGNPFHQELTEIVKENSQVYSDISGLVHSKYKRDPRYEPEEVSEAVENIKQFLGECGPSKLLFGTDFPLQIHSDSIYFIEEAMKNYPLTDKKKVYYKNAERILEGRD
ncbi:MAG: amidohydrolase family protein [Nanoarchaeota archaeon]